MKKYFDAHTHLNNERLFDKYQEYIDAFAEIWGKFLVNVGADENYNTNALTIAKNNTHQGCEILSVLGLHPCEVEERTKSLSSEQGNEKILYECEKLRKLVLENKEQVVAIGECWIDLHYVHTPENLALQEKLFTFQLEFAREQNLPIVIHSRDAFEETFEIMKEYTDLKIYVHCWWYGPAEIKKLFATFPHLWVGFTWNISYPKAQEIRDSFPEVPFDKVLLETDAPYLAPQKMRGKTNQPAFVQYVYDFVSQEFAINPDILEKQIEENFREFYAITSK